MGVTENEMVGWHHHLNEHDFEQTPGDSEGQGSLAYCSPWGHKEWDTTQQLNNKDKKNRASQGAQWLRIHLPSRRLRFYPWDGNRFYHSCLGNPMDRRAWRAAVH